MDPSSGRLVAVEQIVRSRRPRGTANKRVPRASLLFAFPGQDYAYQGGYKASEALRTGKARTSVSTPQLSTEATAGSPERDVFFAGPGEVFDGVYEIQLGTQEEQKAVRAAKLHEKKQRKWSRWASKTIPELLRPYMTLVKETDHFVRETSPLSLPACTCQNRSEWKVVGVYFKGASYGNL